jgi:sugar lactone lactonase YvrE
VLLDKSPARVLLLDPATGRQRTYATFADLPACESPNGAPDCSPNMSDEPATPNYAAWGPKGALYVTDYLQAVIWRVPPGGGRAKVWLANPQLDGGMFGTTGIVLTPDRRKLLVAQQSSAGGGDANPSTGKLYSIGLRGNGADRGLTKLWESRPVDGPDGFALARSGRIYITLTATNQMVVLDREGNEVERFPDQPLTGDNGSPIPFDNPSSAMFLGRRLIVANQSFISGDATHQAILDVYAGERGAPEFIPRRAGLRPNR